MIVSILLDKKKCHASIDIEDILVASSTICNNVNRIADHYRSLIRPILIKQAEADAITICPDL